MKLSDADKMKVWYHSISDDNHKFTRKELSDYTDNAPLEDVILAEYEASGERVDTGSNTVRCTRCGKLSIAHTLYCSNCGSRMRG